MKAPSVQWVLPCAVAVRCAVPIAADGGPLWAVPSSTVPSPSTCHARMRRAAASRQMPSPSPAESTASAKEKVPLDQQELPIWCLPSLLHPLLLVPPTLQHGPWLQQPQLIGPHGPQLSWHGLQQGTQLEQCQEQHQPAWRIQRGMVLTHGAAGRATCKHTSGPGGGIATANTREVWMWRPW